MGQERNEQIVGVSVTAEGKTTWGRDIPPGTHPRYGLRQAVSPMFLDVARKLSDEAELGEEGE